MASHFRVVNLSNGFRLKRSQAARAVENCAAKWVVPGVTIRSLTLGEAVNARNDRARLAEKLGQREGFGLVFQPSESGIPATRREKMLTGQAYNFQKHGIYGAACDWQPPPCGDYRHYVFAGTAVGCSTCNKIREMAEAANEAQFQGESMTSERECAT